MEQHTESRWRGASETSLQVWRNCPVWNINALPHPFVCLPSTSCHSHSNNHLSPLSPSLFPHSTLPLHFCLAHPRLSPVILFIPFFLPFCCGFPPIQVHTSQVSARPYTRLPFPFGGLPWWQVGWMIDRAWRLWAPPLPFETPHTQLAGHKWIPRHPQHRDAPMDTHYFRNSNSSEVPNFTGTYWRMDTIFERLYFHKFHAGIGMQISHGRYSVVQSHNYHISSFQGELSWQHIKCMLCYSMVSSVEDGRVVLIYINLN